MKVINVLLTFSVHFFFNLGFSQVLESTFIQTKDHKAVESEIEQNKEVIKITKLSAQIVPINSGKKQEEEISIDLSTRMEQLQSSNPQIRYKLSARVKSNDIVEAQETISLSDTCDTLKVIQKRSKLNARLISE